MNNKPRPNQPRLKISEQHHDGTAIARALAALVALTNPVALAVATITIVTCRWATRAIRGWHITLAGAGATTIGILVHWPATYIQPWHDLANGHTPTDMWPTWLAAQLPLGTSLGLTTAGIYLAWRDRYTAHWRTPPQPQATSRAITRAKHHLDTTAKRTPAAATIADLTLPLGVDAATARPVHLPATALRTHSLVIGPTGAGKTEALQRLAWTLTAAPAARSLRIPLVVIDMKGDPHLHAWLQSLATETGRDFHLVTTNPETSTGYNPLAGRAADDIADAVYEAVFADDPNLHLHYATLSRRLLQIASHTLTDLANQGLARPGTGGHPWTTSLHALVDLLSPTALQASADLVTPRLAARIGRYLADTTTNDIGDIRDRVAVITDTDAGTILDHPGLNLTNAITTGDIVCFSLDAAAKPETARTFGRLAIHDLAATLADLPADWAHDHICPIILDEFSALATRKIADLYARARSAGGAVILATQDVDADLAAIGSNFAGAVKTNTNIWLVLRQTRAETAETIAHDLGTTHTWKETLQTHDDWDPLGGTHAATGLGSLRQVEEFALHPNQLKNLPLGAAYLITKHPTTTSLNHPTHTTHIQRIHIAQAPTPHPAQPHTTPQAKPTPLWTPPTTQPEEHTPPPPEDY